MIPAYKYQKSGYLNTHYLLLTITTLTLKLIRALIIPLILILTPEGGHGKNPHLFLPVARLTVYCFAVQVNRKLVTKEIQGNTPVETSDQPLG